MIGQALKTSRCSAARLLRRSSVLPCRRSLASATPARRADLLRDLYLSELRRFKPAPSKAGEAEAHVAKFKPPTPPASPEENNIANELKEYEAQTVEVEGRSSEDGAANEALDEDDWLEDDDMEDDNTDGRLDTVGPSGSSGNV